MSTLWWSTFQSTKTFQHFNFLFEFLELDCKIAAICLPFSLKTWPLFRDCPHTDQMDNVIPAHFSLLNVLNFPGSSLQLHNLSCHMSLFNSPQLYENFVEEVDAIDNGISQYDGEARYAVSTTLSARVSHLNPRWNSKSQDTEVRDCMNVIIYPQTCLMQHVYYMSGWWHGVWVCVCDIRWLKCNIRFVSCTFNLNDNGCHKDWNTFPHKMEVVDAAVS